MILGLGDVIIPSLLVVAAAGTLLGVGLLLRLRGGVHAGLPPLNVGAATGYAVACLVVGVPLLPA